MSHFYKMSSLTENYLAGNCVVLCTIFSCLGTVLRSFCTAEKYTSLQADLLRLSLKFPDNRLAKRIYKFPDSGHYLK